MLYAVTKLKLSSCQQYQAIYDGIYHMEMLRLLEGSLWVQNKTLVDKLDLILKNIYLIKTSPHKPYLNESKTE